MKRTLIEKLPSDIPTELLTLMRNAYVYDSSCSPEARVYFIDKGCGYYLKRAQKGALEREVTLARYYHSIGLGVEVCSYLSDDRYDWMLTQSAAGEDCTHDRYLGDPKRLSAMLGETLRALHETSYDTCPVIDRTAEYIRTVEQNYVTGNYDKTAFPDSFGFSDAESAYRLFSQGREKLKSDVLLHGDFCLPNIILDDWRLSSFIDLGCGGVGDRHIDLFWGSWTLWFNLKTDRYAARFFDAYGRDKIDAETLRIISAAEVFG